MFEEQSIKLLQFPKKKSQSHALLRLHYDICLHHISCSSTTISYSCYNSKSWLLDIAVTIQLVLNQLLQGWKSFRSGPTEYKSFSTYTTAALAET